MRGRFADDSGSSSVEVAVLLPVMMLLLMVVVQVALWFHVRAVMTTAANKAVDATRVEQGTSSDGHQAADEFLASTGALDGTVVEVDRSPEVARAEISGQVTSLMFGVPLHISVAVEAPIEVVTP